MSMYGIFSACARRIFAPTFSDFSSSALAITMIDGLSAFAVIDRKRLSESEESSARRHRTRSIFAELRTSSSVASPNHVDKPAENVITVM